MSKILTFGVFDFFHIGHLRLFKQCKKYADYLIVAVQKDDSILKFKPNARKLYSLEERMEMVESIGIVNEVLAYDAITPETLSKIDFDILALGEDHKGERFNLCIKWCDEHNKKVVRLKRTEGICSSDIKSGILKE